MCNSNHDRDETRAGSGSMWWGGPITGHDGTPVPTAIAVLERFTADPLASHSGQFPLGRPGGAPDHSRPSAADVRPWGLRGMRAARAQGNAVLDGFVYDHIRQTALDADGRSLPMAATAKKDTNKDGDEGPSEDYTYDFCPDAPPTI